jgi:hypothetical protein
MVMTLRKKEEGWEDPGDQGFGRLHFPGDSPCGHRSVTTGNRQGSHQRLPTPGYVTYIAETVNIFRKT